MKETFHNRAFVEYLNPLPADSLHHDEQAEMRDEQCDVDIPCSQPDIGKWCCTRRAGHAGDHIAHGCQGMLVYARWSA